MSKIALYVRVSTKEQLEGSSLEVQERICTDFALRNEYQIVKVFVEKGDPLSTLNRLRKFFELFLQEGLNSEFAYLFGLKNA